MFLNVMTPSALALSADTVKLLWQTPLLGMLMIFSVLGLLWAILSVFKLIFVGATPKEKKPVEKKAPEKKPEPPKAETPAPVATAAPAAQSDDELIAVITAAVAAYMAEEGTEYTGGFRVVSFKRVSGGRAWNTK